MIRSFDTWPLGHSGAHVWPMHYADVLDDPAEGGCSPATVDLRDRRVQRALGISEAVAGYDVRQKA